MKLYRYLVLLLMLFVQTALAQTTYPLQVNVHLLPPYSLYLSDYYSGTREKLTVTLINRDQLKPSVNVRLRMIITAPGGIRIQTNDNVPYVPVNVEAGMPVRITQDDLAQYFQPRNLITQGYLSSGRMPEGMVEFCFQAVEAFTGQVLSASSCTRAWITSQKPPLLSLPLNEENVAFRDPLNMLFQWTPMHQGLAHVEYDFIIKELWDNGMAPQAAFPYAPEIYRETLRGTSLSWGAMHPPMLPGKRYAWCIQAKARDGMDEVNLFQNDGYSEIRWFTLQDNCMPPNFVEATAERKRISLMWGTSPEHVGFTVGYRLIKSKTTTLAAGDQVEAGAWKELQVNEPSAVLYGLQSGGTYEYRVASLCMTGVPVYGDIFTVTLPATDSARLAQCGIMPEVNLLNQEPIQELKTSEVFVAGDFPITITRLSGANGTYTGEGWTVIPWLNDAKVAVEFTTIVINTDKQMISGFVEAQYDKNESQIANADDVFEGGFDQGIVKTGLTRVDYSFDFSIPGVESFMLDDEGTLVITDSDGNEHAVTAQTSMEGGQNEGDKVVVFPMTVKDKDGNVFLVEKVTETDAAGNTSTVAKATHIGNMGATLAEDSFDRTQLDFEKAIVTFSKGSGYYAFDTWEPYYDKISLIESKYEKLHQDYYVPWKLLVSGKTDVVSAAIRINDPIIDADKVEFKTPKGVTLTASRKGNVYTIQLVDGPAGDVQELYALYPKGDGKYWNLGKLSIATYAPQRHDVVLVSVEGTVIDSGIEAKLKEVYGPVGVTFSVLRDTMAYDTEQLMKQSTGLRTYNEAMRTLNNTYRARRTSFSRKTNYLFFLKATGNVDINNRDFTGFMPRGGQFGYIFTSEIKDINEPVTVAHELGHGRFKLYHTFDAHYGGYEQGNTTNIMDYSNKTHFAKWQWDQVHDPAMVVSVFEGDEKSAMVDVAEASVPDNYVPPCGMEGKPPVVETLLLYSKNCSSHFEGSVINLIKKGYGAYLCANERFAVIKCLSNGVFTLSYKEDAIIDLIIGTPSVHAAELLQYLKQDNSGLIRKIEDGFQFENYVSVFKAIQQLYLKGTTQTTISAEVEKINSTFLSDKTREEKAQQQYFTWFEGGILKAMFADNFIFSRFDNVVIADDGTVTFQYATDPNQHGESTTQISIKPFALVGIRIRGNTNEVLEAGNGSMVYVPGITLPLLISKKETAELFDALNSTAVVTGVGTVITGTTRFVIVSGGIDILLGSSALIVDSYKDDILKMSYGPDFLDAYVLVNKAFLVYFGARTSVHLAQATLALPKLQSSFSIFRNSDDFAKLKVTNSSKAAQIENEVEQLLKKGEEIAKGGAKTLATSGDELLALGRNIFKGSDEMLQAAKTKIADFRIAMKGKKKLGGNLGYVEGDLNGVKLDDELVSSTANFDNPDIFNAKFVNNQNQIRPDAIDGAYLRTGDSEFQMLSNVAQKFNLQKGQVYNYTGTIKVVSELPYCASCSGVIHQFSEMLPNVKIIIVNGAK